MKWNNIKETKPSEYKCYVVRIEGKDGFYGCLYAPKEGSFSCAYSDRITHWAERHEFNKAFETMKRPSNETLIRNFLNEYSGEELAKRFAEFFNDDEMKEILLEKMSESSKQALADDEWDDYCFKADCEREDRLWRSGYYS